MSNISPESFSVRPATFADLGDLWLIMEQARQFKCAHGDFGWGQESFTWVGIATQIGRGRTQIGSVDGAPAVALEILKDGTRVWGPDMGADSQAAYLHSFGTADQFRHQGAGRLMLKWASQQIAADGYPYVRLDCNRDLMPYYSKYGFVALGFSPFVDYPTVLHQKQLSLAA